MFLVIKTGAHIAAAQYKDFIRVPLAFGSPQPKGLNHWKSNNMLGRVNPEILLRMRIMLAIANARTRSAPSPSTETREDRQQGNRNRNMIHVN
ncbi:MAG: hypothetical protein OXI87_18045 [Albidovulum sp.]|nr:hypothetical protein [Albidovulum sp.]MDE0532879.1 hypothetical protein [Albidovulum sp.]